MCRDLCVLPYHRFQKDCTLPDWCTLFRTRQCRYLRSRSSDCHSTQLDCPQLHSSSQTAKSLAHSDFLECSFASFLPLLKSALLRENKLPSTKLPARAFSPSLQQLLPVLPALLIQRLTFHFWCAPLFRLPLFPPSLIFLLPIAPFKLEALFELTFVFLLWLFSNEPLPLLFSAFPFRLFPVKVFPGLPFTFYASPQPYLLRFHS